MQPQLLWQTLCSLSYYGRHCEVLVTMEDTVKSVTMEDTVKSQLLWKTL